MLSGVSILMTGLSFTLESIKTVATLSNDIA